MKSMTQKLSLASMLVLSLAAPQVWAEDKKPDDEVTFNATLTSDYRYRGLSQTRLQPALQGGADYVNNPTGFYAGTWLSTIKWIKDAGGDANVEWDLYAGKRGEIVKDVSYDVGGLYYFYPSNGLPVNANTFELYGQVGYGPAYAKYSVSTTNLFGTADSKHSGYLDLGANVDLGSGYTLNLHAGHQTVKSNSVYSYSDYKVGVTKDLGVCSVALALVGTNTDVYVTPAGKNTGKTSAVLSITKNF
ncbi:MAG: TorF family putative porin [Telluria sp.]